MVDFSFSHAEESSVGRSGSSAAPTLRRLIGAAVDLDTKSMAGILRISIARHGVVSTWERLIRPALTALGVGADGAARPSSADILFRRAVFEELSRVRRSLSGSAPVLVACADEEHESLPLDAVAAALAESGTDCIALRARVPPQAVTGAVRRLRPWAVVIWSHTRETADPGQLEPLLRFSPAPALIAAGPGWRFPTLPSPVKGVPDVGGAVATTRARRRPNAADPTSDLVDREPAA